ncbi:hypothetical protein WM15_23870 [Burkholderia ubonensis]|nr:hypothetical protein WM15_23870 [Burkholderia ubonensis]
MTELEYLRLVDRPVYRMLVMMAFDLLVRAVSELHCFTDIDEGVVNTVAEEAKRLWEAAEAESIEV